MYMRGVSASSLEDVLAASGTGKSQLYHYFSSKEDLVAEVLSHQLDQILKEQSSFPIDTWAGIHAWLDALVRRHQTELGFHGCPLGSLVSEVLDLSDQLHSRAAALFSRWESSLAERLRTMQGLGLLRKDAGPETLAEAIIAILQGGYLLSSIKRDVRPMQSAVAAALTHLQSFASSPGDEQPAPGTTRHRPRCTK